MTLALVLAQVVWLSVWPAVSWAEFASQQFELAAALIACFACANASRKSHFYAKNFWQFSALTFALWSLGSIVNSLHDMKPSARNDEPFWIVFLIFFSTAPMFVAALIGGGETEKRVRWDLVIDVSQLLILVIALHVMLVAIPAVTAGGNQAAGRRLFILAGWRGALALALVLRTALSRSQVVRQLVAPVAGAMSLFALGSALGNYIDRFQLWSRVEWFDLAWTIPLCHGGGVGDGFGASRRKR